MSAFLGARACNKSSLHGAALWPIIKTLMENINGIFASSAGSVQCRDQIILKLRKLRLATILVYFQGSWKNISKATALLVLSQQKSSLGHLSLGVASEICSSTNTSTKSREMRRLERFSELNPQLTLKIIILSL